MGPELIIFKLIKNNKIHYFNNNFTEFWDQNLYKLPFGI